MARNGAKTRQGNFQTRGGFTHIRRRQEWMSRMVMLGGRAGRSAGWRRWGGWELRAVVAWTLRKFWGQSIETTIRAPYEPSIRVWGHARALHAGWCWVPDETGLVSTDVASRRGGIPVSLRPVVSYRGTAGPSSGSRWNCGAVLKGHVVPPYSIGVSAGHGMLRGIFRRTRP